MRWGLLAAGIGAYAAALIALLPATLLDAVVQDASKGRIRLTEARGTLWSGSGRIEIRDAGGISGYGKPVTWRALPLALLRAQLACELVLDPGSPPIRLSAARSGLHLSQADIRLPAAAAGLALPKLALLRLGGELRVQVTELVIDGGAMRGSALLEWRAAASALSPVSPLGDYALELQGEGPITRATLRTLKGPLHLDGTGSWASGQMPAFGATARVPAGEPPEVLQRLAPFLRLIAVEQPDGSFQLKI